MAESKRAAPAIATPAPRQAHLLTRGLLLMERQAGRIEIWQSTREGPGKEVPKERWDPAQRAEYELYKDLAQLCYLVRLVEPDFKAIVSKKLGKPAKKRKTEEQPVYADADEPSPDPPAD